MDWIVRNWKKEKRHEKMQCVFETEFQEGIISVFGGKVFGEEQGRLVVGTADGKIAIFGQGLGKEGGEKEKVRMEAVSGPVGVFVLHNTQGLQGQDLLCGCTDGELNVLASNGQLIGRLTSGAAITCVAVCVDGGDNQTIVVGTVDGTLIGFHGLEQMWKVTIRDCLPVVHREGVEGGMQIESKNFEILSVCDAHVVSGEGGEVKRMIALSEGSEEFVRMIGERERGWRGREDRN
eukprot:TRINITY_DN1710_c0_g1_i8.p2 TRINITY_DN1710_c0_g1~~TRINITY_DN1710_c0_g1_i8.p2  ORF type:complete len:235 (-),score=71.71 TRINITY_DN1710_c0_g1_i8:3414-4118(-)